MKLGQHRCVMVSVLILACAINRIWLGVDDDHPADMRGDHVPNSARVAGRYNHSMFATGGVAPDKALIQNALGQMQASLEVVGARDVFRKENDTNHLAGTARMGSDSRSSVVDADCRSWDIPNLWVCDGTVFPTTGGVNPSSTITAIAMRTADRIKAMASRGELEKRASHSVTD